MADLTERELKILKTIVEEYIETAEPVGSETLDKKHALGISPATIRNEMVKLTKSGYLKQSHASAGRIPTPEGFKYYINSLMEEKKLSVVDEVAAKEAIWDYRFEFDRLMHEITHELADRTNSLAIAATNNGDLYSAGYSHILEMPEFYDIDLTRGVLALIDQVTQLQAVFDRAFGDDQIHVLVGEEMKEEFLRPCSLVFAHFDGGAKRSGAIGIIGPCRQNYSQVIPTVRYFSTLINEIAANW